MKPGKLVTYVHASGKTEDAEVVDIVGTGASGYKLLDLRIGNRKKNGVWHVKDVAKGAHWIEYRSEHAAADLAVSQSVPAPVVPATPPAGRAAAGVGDSKDKE